MNVFVDNNAIIICLYSLKLQTPTASYWKIDFISCFVKKVIAISVFFYSKLEFNNDCVYRFGSSSSQTSTGTADFCRICHETDSISPLLTPCLCAGSLRFVHQSCLQLWLTASEMSSCELCMSYTYIYFLAPNHF